MSVHALGPERVEVWPHVGPIAERMGGHENVGAPAAGTEAARRPVDQVVPPVPPEVHLKCKVQRTKFT